MKAWITIVSENAWLKALVEFVLFTGVGVALSLVLAHSPSLDDVVRGGVIGLILGCFYQAGTRLNALNIKKEERKRTAKFLETTLSDRIGEPITSDTVVQVARQVTKEDKASDKYEWKDDVV